MSLLPALACRKNRLSFWMSGWLSFPTLSLYPSWWLFTPGGPALPSYVFSCFDVSGIFSVGDAFSSHVKALTWDASWGTSTILVRVPFGANKRKADRKRQAACRPGSEPGLGTLIFLCLSFLSCG